MKKYLIELDETQLSLIIKAVGNQKKFLNDGGFYHVAHINSDLLAHLKNNSKEVITNE
jgi:hypothetical protein